MLPKSACIVLKESFMLFMLYENTLYSNCQYAVAQLVEALHYKPEGRGFDS